MPHQIMAAHDLTIRLSQIHNRIALSPAELILLRFDRSPLHNQLAFRYSIRRITFCEFPGVICPKSSVLLSSWT